MHIGLDIMGGIESFISYISNELANYNDNDITFCSISKPENSSSCFYSRLNSKIKTDYLVKEYKGFSISVIYSIYKYLLNSTAEIIHIHGFFYYYALAILLLHKKKTFVYTIHSDAFQENTKWDKKLFWYKKYCFKHRWMHAVTISPQSKESFTRLYGAKSRLIENGILRPLINVEDNKVEEFKVTNKTRIFLHPGRICKEKNQLVLCRVFNQLIAEGFDIVLLIAGTIQSEEIYCQIKPLLSKRIRFLGERNDISQLFYHSDGFCLPSLWEGLPITLLEALSVGCPPICSPVGGIVSVIKNGVNGILSSSSEEIDYFNAMKYFLNLSIKDIGKIKSECIKSFNKYDIKNVAKQYLSFYNEVLEC